MSERRGVVALIAVGPLMLLCACQIATVAGGPGGSGTTVATAVSQVPTGAGDDTSGVTPTLRIADTSNSVVRAITESNDEESVIAGNGTAGYSGDGGSATAAELQDPTAITRTTSTHDVIITDTGNDRIRIVAGSTHTAFGISMTSGDIYTLAGNGQLGYSGDSGAGSSAELNEPKGLSADASNNVLIADSGNSVIRVVAKTTGTFYGVSMTAGDIYTIAGDGSAGYAGDGGSATAAELQDPLGIDIDNSGNILIADSGNSAIRVVAETTGTFYGISMTPGDIYTIAGDGSAGYAGDSGMATSAELNDPESVAATDSYNAVISDTDNNVIRVVAGSTGSYYGISMTAGDIYTVAGNGTAGYSGDSGAATSAELNHPTGVSAKGNGSIEISDTGNDRIRLVKIGTSSDFGISMTSHHIYTVGGNGNGRYSGDGYAADAAQLNAPYGVTVANSSGNVITSDSQNNAIRVVAGVSGTFYGISMTAGDIYTVAGDGTAGYSGDGGPATSATLDLPTEVALDSSGNVVVSDTGNDVIRVVAEGTGTYYGLSMTAGDIYTVAGDGTVGYSGDGASATSAELNFSTGIAVDGYGDLVISDSDNNVVRVVAEATGTYYGLSMTAGDIYTVAGNGTAGYSGDSGTATSAELNFPAGVDVDGSGNVLVADASNNAIRVVAEATGTYYGLSMTAGDIYTVAGNGTAGYSGDSGTATSAELNFPTAVTADSVGDMMISDNGNNVIRAVAGFTGTFEGNSVTAGDIYTLAGTGTGGYSGDGSNAADYELSDPNGLALNSSDDLYIADTGNGRIRELT